MVVNTVLPSKKDETRCLFKPTVFSVALVHFSNHPYCNTGKDVQSWSELLAPLVNMIKEGSENKPVLLILLISYFFFKITKIQPFIELKQLKMAENLIMK